jgi:hypothetical protein
LIYFVKFRLENWFGFEICSFLRLGCSPLMSVCPVQCRVATYRLLGLRVPELLTTPIEHLGSSFLLFLSLNYPSPSHFSSFSRSSPSLIRTPLHLPLLNHHPITILLRSVSSSVKPRLLSVDIFLILFPLFKKRGDLVQYLLSHLLLSPLLSLSETPLGLRHGAPTTFCPKL